MAYNPVYTSEPFTKFDTVEPSTTLASLNFNWREQDLPERKRTKHVHRLHPYLGKYIPQLVEIFLRKYQPKIVCDPFAGSGTTLVEAAALGIDSVGTDVSAFNCLLAKVKTDKYDLEKLEAEIKDALGKIQFAFTSSLFSQHIPHIETDNEYLKTWFAPKALRELLYYRSLISNYKWFRSINRVICH